MRTITQITRTESFRTSTGNLELIRNFVINNLRLIEVSDELIDNITLAVDEACTNVIKHAYDKSDEGRMLIKLDFDSPKLNISVIDYGRGFDPSKLPIPNIKEYYKAHKVGGWGIYLMKSLMDEVSFNFEPGVKNEIALIKYIK